MNAAVALWRREKRLYGVRTLHATMRRAGFDVGRDQVGRLMPIAGIEGVRRGKHSTTTTIGDATAARHLDLVGRDADAPTRPNELWVADFERHEVFTNRAVVKGHRGPAVAAVG